MILWFTGQPGSGKTTLSNELKKEFGQHVIQIDGNDLRTYFHAGYNKFGRTDNIIRAQQLAKMLHAQEFLVIVSLVSPYLDLREQLKKEMGNNLIEIYLHTSEKRGKEKYFAVGYEQPLKNFTSYDTGKMTVQECVDDIKEMLSVHW